MAISAATLYPLLLLWSLQQLIGPNFSYMGYVFAPPVDPWLTSLTLILAVVPSMVLPISGETPGSIMLWIFYLLIYVPGQIMPAFTSGASAESFVPLQVYLLLGLLIAWATSSLPPVRFPRLRISPNAFWIFVLGLSAISYLIIIDSYGFPTGIQGLTDVYDVRSDFRSEAQAGGAVTSYIISWQSKVINPLLIGRGISQKSIVTLSAGLLGQVFVYASTGSKSALFSGLLVLVLVALLGRSRSVFGPLMVIGTSGLVLVTTTIDLVTQSILLGSLFVRRLILTPGLLTGYYFEFFSEFPRVHLSNSILSPLFSYPYDRPYPFVIGLKYFNSADTSANANVWADAFANFGPAGIMGFSFVLGLLLWIFNSFALDRDKRIAGILAGMSAYSLVNSALFTSLLTHGIAFSIVVLFFLPASRYHSDSSHSTSPS